MNIDPDWNLETAFLALSERYTPGSLLGGHVRNLMLQIWGELVGRKRALAELEGLLLKSASRTRFCRTFRISHKRLATLEASFRALPAEEKRGRWQPGDRIGPWTLLRPLGSGGSSEVWRAVASTLGECAVKLPHLGARKRQRFRAELQILRQLNGTTGVMPVIATSADQASGDQSTPWLAMPIARGVKHVVADRNNNAPFVIRGVTSLALAVSVLHAKGVSHRDIKPDNIYVLKQRWLLGDFGIASFPGKPQLTVNGRKLGPIYFIAPEMLNSAQIAAGPPADVYSLAKTLWVLMSGQAFPPPGEQRITVPALRLSSYVAVPGSESLDELIDQCTRHEPNERPTAHEMFLRLREVL